ncbi:MAG: hypothetical protein IT379_04745 [Deltaproteobacteria bacterium]|nr:hypothetical protein [Deltaproteobacteria bacterium]
MGRPTSREGTISRGPSAPARTPAPYLLAAGLFVVVGCRSGFEAAEGDGAAADGRADDARVEARDADLDAGAEEGGLDADTGARDAMPDAPVIDATMPDGADDDAGPDAGGDGGPSTCVGSLDCDDGVFCNGRERCLPGDPTADARGCLPADAERCLPGQTCDEPTDTCITACGASTDVDRDGHDAIACGGDDCDDSRADVFPGAPELCNGLDESCNGVADDGSTACDRMGTIGACVAGRCTIRMCSTPWADCNGVSDDGCEADTRSDAAHCGACGATCGPGGTCAMRACDGVREVEAGATHTCVLRESGGLACWGSNGRGELGLGATGTMAREPLGVAAVTDALDLCAGTAFTCAVLRGGGVDCWGANDSGQLGDGRGMSGLESADPVAVVDVAGATAVACGGEHACALIGDGTVRCWGRNLEGQLGDGTTAPRVRPVQVQGLAGARAIASGGRHSCAIRSDRRVVCWGSNDEGQLGDGRGMLGVISTVPTEVAGLTEAEAMDAGISHTCARRTDGSLLCWGLDERGQLGNGTGGSGVIEPSPVLVMGGIVGVGGLGLGLAHSCALASGGGVACWGEASDGRLGDGEPVPPRGFVPTAVLVEGVTGALGLTAGDAHACVRIGSGSLRCWGRNLSGQLGDGTALTQVTPVPVVGFP